jgi:predicted enzyme related to lactoylglutathione lyase
MEENRRRVIGIGGIFFKSKNPQALVEWYKKHLGLEIREWGGTAFPWCSPDLAKVHGATVWSVFPAQTDYFAPSQAPFMINYCVEDLPSVLDALRAEGCAVDERTESSEHGKFGWVVDPEGNRIELWEPPPGGCPP